MVLFGSCNNFNYKEYQMNKEEIGFLLAGFIGFANIILVYLIINQMKKISELDILVGCLEILDNYFIIQEFSHNKISLYQKVIYNNLVKLIEEKKKK